jgi:undecaprenyl diphosphate synthase
LKTFFLKRLNELHKKNIKLNIIGTKNFSKKLNKLLISSEKKTLKNTKLQINLALNYGSKFEILNALKIIE